MSDPKAPISEGMKTAGLAGLAAFLCILAAIFGSRPDPAPVFGKLGSAFYPDFQDPLKATALEVIEYDEAAAYAKPFKVELAGGKWSIPSHSGYPADAKERLAKTAGSVIGLTKDQLASETEKDHEALGVVDPLDANVAGGKGRGKRVVFYAGGAALAQFVFGNAAGEGKRYVRVPGEKQTWISKTPGEISAKFEDWVETDLLQVTAASLRRVVIDKYSFDEAEVRIKDRTVNTMTREDGAKPWVVNETKETEELNDSNVNALVSTLDDLKIAGVRRKPALVGKAKDLNELSTLPRQQIQAIAADLAPRGFFVASLDGKTISIVCNEGEMAASCDDGVVYSLRFGEVIVGAGEQISAGGSEEKKDGKKDGAEHRFLFVGVRFDESLLGPAPVAPPEYKADPAKKPEDQQMDEAKAKAAKDDYERKKKDFEQKVADGKKRKEKLEARFAEWYYVISGESFKKLRLDRAGLLKPKEKKEEGKPGEPKHDEKDGHKHDEKPAEKKAEAKPAEKPAEKPAPEKKQ